MGIKNQKGFTLVELMAVIVVLAIIIAIAVPVYNKVKTNLDENNYKNKVELIEVAASKYAEDNHVEVIFVNDLVRDGYLEADENGEVYKIIDGKKTVINCALIKMTDEKGIYYSELFDDEDEIYLDPNAKDNVTCDMNQINEHNDKVKIVMYEESVSEDNKIQYNADTKWWTRKNVMLKAEINPDIKVAEIKWFKGSLEEEVTEGFNDDKTQLYVPTDSIHQSNYTLKIKTQEENKKSKTYTTSVWVYIDKVNPIFYQDDEVADLEKWTKTKKYIPDAHDDNSGIYGYYVEKIANENETLVYENVTCPEDKKAYFKTKELTIEENGKYISCVMDNVGNYTKRTNVIEVKKIDNIGPECVWSGEDTDWTKENRTIKLECSDTESGCTTTPKQWTYSQTIRTVDLSYTIKDVAENETVCSKKVNVYVDKDKPTCGSWSGESTNWTSGDRTIKVGCSDIGSGCTASSYNVKTYSSGTKKTEALSYTIKDVAENETVCSKTVNVYVDKTPPTCVSSGGSTAWISASSGRTLVGTCSDTGSGCKGNVSWLINWAGQWTNLSPGTVFDNVGNPTVCPGDQTVKVESVTAPSLSSSSSTYDSITANYSAGAATSGIKSKACYYGTSSNPTTAGTVSGNNCVFSVAATSSNTKYYFKKCITSNNGVTVCSGVSNKNNVGYCTSGNYTTTTNKRYITHDVYVNNKDKANSSGDWKISQHYTYCYRHRKISKYNDKTCENTVVFCPNGYNTGHKNCNSSISSSCDYKVLRDTKALEIKTSMPDYFDKVTRYDSGNWHVKTYQHCKKGTESGCVTNSDKGFRYRVDGNGNVHEWYYSTD